MSITAHGQTRGFTGEGFLVKRNKMVTGFKPRPAHIPWTGCEMLSGSAPGGYQECLKGFQGKCCTPRRAQQQWFGSHLFLDVQIAPCYYFQESCDLLLSGSIGTGKRYRLLYSL